MGERITRHQDLIVYKKAFEASMSVFDVSKRFPKEEIYSLTDQIRRSSRSVTANLAEAWRKREYTAAFVAKIKDAEGEAAETQTWLEYAVRCGYLLRDEAKAIFLEYDEVLAMLFAMAAHPEKWVIKTAARRAGL